MSAPSRVFIHADESCLGNQFKERASPGGAGGLVEVWRAGEWIRRDFFLSEPDTTNNRMAIRSAIEGLGLLTRPCRVGKEPDQKNDLPQGGSVFVRRKTPTKTHDVYL